MKDLLSSLDSQTVPAWKTLPVGFLPRADPCCPDDPRFWRSASTTLHKVHAISPRMTGLRTVEIGKLVRWLSKDAFEAR